MHGTKGPLYVSTSISYVTLELFLLSINFFVKGLNSHTIKSSYLKVNAFTALFYSYIFELQVPALDEIPKNPCPFMFKRHF